MSYAYSPTIAAQAAVDERVSFLKRTYLHLAGAVGAFVGLEALLLQTELAPEMVSWLSAGRFRWFVVLGAFIVSGMVARWWAHASPSRGMQYAGLALCVAAWAVIFLPILWFASSFAQFEGVIPKAAIMTLTMFGGLTIGVLMTKNDFSYLGKALWIGTFAMLGIALASAIFGFDLGVIFSFAGVALACGFILYDTSQVLHHYRTDQHVGAALELFASLALLFWYVLQLVMAFSGRD